MERSKHSQPELSQPEPTCCVLLRERPPPCLSLGLPPAHSLHPLINSFRDTWFACSLQSPGPTSVHRGRHSYLLQYLHVLAYVSPAEISCLTFVLFCLWSLDQRLQPACLPPPSLMPTPPPLDLPPCPTPGYTKSTCSPSLLSCLWFCSCPPATARP